MTERDDSFCQTSKKQAILRKQKMIRQNYISRDFQTVN